MIPPDSPTFRAVRLRSVSIYYRNSRRGRDGAEDVRMTNADTVRFAAVGLFIESIPSRIGMATRLTLDS